MVCNSCLRSVIVRAGNTGIISGRKFWFSGTQQKNLHASLRLGVNYSSSLKYSWSFEFLRCVKMMVDSSSSQAAKREPIVDVLTEKDEESGYVSGGWKRLLDFDIS